MPLPTIETPKYHLTLPSNNESVEFRPFLVKEEKVLMIAQEAGTESSLIAAMKDVINACTFKKLDLYSLPMSDIEYLLLQIRSKSAGETSQFKIKCEHCEEYADVEIDLSQIEVRGETSNDNVVKLTDEVGITLRAPSLKDAEKALRRSNRKQNDIVQGLSSIIESVYDENEVYPFDQASPKEIEAFIESLSSEQVLKINDWVSTIPALSHDLEYTCPNNHKNTKTLSGLGDFFT